MTKTYLLAAALFALGMAQAQTVQIGPNGVSVNTGSTRVNGTGAAGGGPVYAFTGSGWTRSYTCHNTRVSVAGSGNHLTLKGVCRAVSVAGSGNAVQVEAVGRLSVAGSANAVTWHSGLNGQRPAVEMAGVGNSVRRQ